MLCEHPRRRVSRRSAFVSAALAAVGLISGATTLLAPATAQEPGTVTAAARTSAATVARGGKGEMLVTLTIKPGWHVYSNNPGSENYIPTTISATGATGVTVGKPRFPKAESLKTSIDPKPLNVYENKAVIAVPFTVAKTAKPGKYTLKATVGYQTCNDQTCLPPDSLPVTATVTVK